jgi:TPR repeat protein
MSVHPSGLSAYQSYGSGQQAIQALTGGVPPVGEAEDWFAEGVSYELGSGLKTDLAKAFQCYEKASKRDDVDALIRLAFFHTHGIGRKVDPTESERLLKRAVELGSAHALFDLGRSWFRKGMKEGQEQIQSKALQSITIAEEKGYKEALIFKAYFTVVGSSVVAEDVQKGTQILEEAAGTGDMNALLILGDLYYHGIGVRKNAEKALEYYRRGADRGSIAAFVKLGKLLLIHTSIPIEAATICLWEEEAERHNHPGAQYLMGILHWMGVGIEGSEEEAIRFLRMAADGGVGEAIPHLQELGAFHEADIVGEGDLLRWARAGANAFNVKAISQLGRLYEQGEGVEKDLRKAIDCYTSSLSFEYNHDALIRLWELYSAGGPVLQDLRAASEVVRQYLFNSDSIARFETLKAK